MSITEPTWHSGAQPFPNQTSTSHLSMQAQRPGHLLPCPVSSLWVCTTILTGGDEGVGGASALLPGFSTSFACGAAHTSGQAPAKGTTSRALRDIPAEESSPWPRRVCTGTRKRVRQKERKRKPESRRERSQTPARPSDCATFSPLRAPSGPRAQRCLGLISKRNGSKKIGNFYRKDFRLGAG